MGRFINALQSHLEEKEMGALKEHFEELETKHKLEVGELEMRIIDLETELSMIRERYDSMCGKVRTNANDKRNEGDHFLSSYGKDRNGPWN
jgi:hypothetical protein